MFPQMLQDIVGKHGSELSLVLAWDEAVPGNILQPDLPRKSALTYASLAQIIPWLEESWMTLTHQHASSIALSKNYDSVMNEVREGFTIDFEGPPVLLTIGTITIVAEADGIRLLTGCKGSSALKPCLHRANVLMGHSVRCQRTQTCVLKR